LEKEERKGKKEKKSSQKLETMKDNKGVGEDDGGSDIER